MYQFHTTKLTIIFLKYFPLIHISHDSMANTTVQKCDIQPFSLFTLWALGMCLYPFSWRNFIKSSSVPEVLIPEQNISQHFIFQLVTLSICIMLHRNYNRSRKYRSPMCRLEYKKTGGIPYTAHGEQITPPPLFFIFVYFLFLCLF